MLEKKTKKQKIDNEKIDNAIEELERVLGLIKQNGKDWFDERDIPLLETAIDALHKVSYLTDRPCSTCVFNEDENGCKKWSCMFEEEYKYDDTRRSN